MSGSVLLESIVTFRPPHASRQSFGDRYESSVGLATACALELGAARRIWPSTIFVERSALSLRSTSTGRFRKLEVQESHGFTSRFRRRVSGSAQHDAHHARLNSTLAISARRARSAATPRLVTPSLDIASSSMRLRRTYAVQSPQIRHLMLTYQRRWRTVATRGGLALVEAVTAGLGHLCCVTRLAQPRALRSARWMATAAKRLRARVIDAAL